MSEVTTKLRRQHSATAFLFFSPPYLAQVVHFLDCIVFTVGCSTWPNASNCSLALAYLDPAPKNVYFQAGGQSGPGEAEKSETMKKPTRRPGVKPPPDRAKRSIFLFKLKNPIRQFCITVTQQLIIFRTKIDICFFFFSDNWSQVVWNLHPVSDHWNMRLFSGGNTFFGTHLLEHILCPCWPC